MKKEKTKKQLESIKKAKKKYSKTPKGKAMHQKARREYNEASNKERVCANPDCHKAGKLQPLTNFGKAKTGKLGRKGKCKYCLNEIQKIRNRNDKQREKRRKEEKRQKFEKEYTKCSLCGKKNCLVQGHHDDFNTGEPIFVCKVCNIIIKKLRLLTKSG